MKAGSEHERQKQEKSLLTFLKRTRDGKYARIDLEALLPGRVQEEREQTPCEEQYYYSVT
jgi:hypothetical protein